MTVNAGVIVSVPGNELYSSAVASGRSCLLMWKPILQSNRLFPEDGFLYRNT